MAYTKIYKIKNNDHAQKAIDYILEKEKDNEFLITSQGTNYNSIYSSKENASNIIKNFEDIQNQNSRHKIKARHLIQSFTPGECTPELAHKIGLELAEKLLNNNFQFVISTHTDKEHIHNHIIFNNVGYDNTCFYDSEKMYEEIQKISDQICEKHNLNIIKSENKEKQNTNKKTSVDEKAQEKTQINKTPDDILNEIFTTKIINSIEDFVKILKENYKCTVSYLKKDSKEYKKNISIKFPNFEKSKRIPTSELLEAIKKQDFKDIKFKKIYPDKVDTNKEIIMENINQILKDNKIDTFYKLITELRAKHKYTVFYKKENNYVDIKIPTSKKSTRIEINEIMNNPHHIKISKKDYNNVNIKNERNFITKMKDIIESVLKKFSNKKTNSKIYIPKDEFLKIVKNDIWLNNMQKECYRLQNTKRATINLYLMDFKKASKLTNEAKERINIRNNSTAVLLILGNKNKVKNGLKEYEFNYSGRTSKEKISNIEAMLTNDINEFNKLKKEYIENIYINNYRKSKKIKRIMESKLKNIEKLKMDLNTYKQAEKVYELGQNDRNLFYR